MSAEQKSSAALLAERVNHLRRNSDSKNDLVGTGVWNSHTYEDISSEGSEKTHINRQPPNPCSREPLRTERRIPESNSTTPTTFAPHRQDCTKNDALRLTLPASKLPQHRARFHVTPALHAQSRPQAAFLMLESPLSRRPSPR